jgi:hypothetical protein
LSSLSSAAVAAEQEVNSEYICPREECSASAQKVYKSNLYVPLKLDTLLLSQEESSLEEGLAFKLRTTPETKIHESINLFYF